MEQDRAVEALAALAQDTRLNVFRMLIRAGPSGMTAGSIASTLSAQPSTMSHHLGLLERARLVRSHREGRAVIYVADYEGTRELLGFLTEDCCQGRPELCGARISDPLSCSPNGNCE